MVFLIVLLLLVPLTLLYVGFTRSSVYPTNEDVEVINDCLKQEVDIINLQHKFKVEVAREIQGLKKFIKDEFNKYDSNYKLKK